jgi:hypothetical protein
MARAAAPMLSGLRVFTSTTRSRAASAGEIKAHKSYDKPAQVTRGRLCVPRSLASLLRHRKVVTNFTDWSLRLFYEPFIRSLRPFLSNVIEGEYPVEPEKRSRRLQW